MEASSGSAGQTESCPVCRKLFRIPTLGASAAGRGRMSNNGGADIQSSVQETLSGMAGVERLQGFSLGAVFSEAFRSHPWSDVETVFSVGGPKTTPPIRTVDTSWPKPWVFLRALFWAVSSYLLFLLATYWFENPKLLPGLMVTGSFAVPIATLIFFFEMNVLRDVSLVQIIRMVVVGGVLSLLISLFLFNFSIVEDLSDVMLGDSVAGFVEEPGKLFALVAVARTSRRPFTLNGLLLGAAIGTGFAAFESSGYAFESLFEDTDDVLDAVAGNIFLRGFLSPFGHIVWTAIAGGALWRVQRDRPFAFSMLCSFRFLRLFAFSVVLHMLWNSSFGFFGLFKYVILGVVGWFLVFSLLQEGLREVRLSQTSSRGRNNFPNR